LKSWLIHITQFYWMFYTIKSLFMENFFHYLNKISKALNFYLWIFDAFCLFCWWRLKKVNLFYLKTKKLLQCFDLLLINRTSNLYKFEWPKYIRQVQVARLSSINLLQIEGRGQYHYFHLHEVYKIFLTFNNDKKIIYLLFLTYLCAPYVITKVFTPEVV